LRSLTGLIFIVAAATASAQQVGETVPEAALRGPVYSLDRPPPGVRSASRVGDGVAIAYVQALQRALPTHGYRCGPVTGTLDPATAQAILAYQRDAHLPQDTDGIGALKATLDHLTYAKPPVFAQNRSGSPPAAAAPVQLAPDVASTADAATIRQVQQHLKDKGYDLDVNGRLDQYTVNAIKVFQAANGLPRDGKIDPYLVDLLAK
jgi:peptidoglycan hydrolase-like protein with peptidoglycan-binding domain